MNYLPCVLLFLSVMSSNLVLGSYNTQRHRDDIPGSIPNEDLNKLYVPRPLSGPYFDLRETSGNVTVVLYKTARLNCRVKNIGNNTVSWLRYDQTKVLTIGMVIQSIMLHSIYLK